MRSKKEGDTISTSPFASTVKKKKKKTMTALNTFCREPDPVSASQVLPGKAA